jgi:hypothetical protein
VAASLHDKDVIMREVGQDRAFDSGMDRTRGCARRLIKPDMVPHCAWSAEWRTLTIPRLVAVHSATQCQSKGYPDQTIYQA